jgi:hypothetical protein
MRWRRRRDRKTDDAIVGWTRWNIKIRVGGRTAIADAEMLVGRRWTPNFIVQSTDMAWEDDSPVTDEEREEVLRVLRESAAKKKMKVEVI